MYLGVTEIRGICTLKMSFKIVYEEKNADIIIPSEHVYWSNRKCRDLKSNYIETVLFYFQAYTEVIVYLAVLFYFQGYTEVIVYLTDINDNSPVFTQNSYNGKIQENSPVNKEVIIVSFKLFGSPVL